MMPRKLGRPGPDNLALNPEVLAVGLALVLVGGLFVVMLAGVGRESGTRLVGPDGCAAQVWRNPVTGRTEAVGRARLDRDGRPLCR